MSGSDGLTAFERRLRELLEQDAQASSGYVRSRLRRARYTALAAATGRRGAWRAGLPGRRVWLPLLGAASAALVWVTVLGPRHETPPPFAADSAGVTVQDVALLTDRDGPALLEDGDGEFYEWAAAQASGSSSGEPTKHGG